MKRIISLFCLILLLVVITVQAQDNAEEKLNLPGDNLNLYAVMQLFQESKTLEDFEKNLNVEDSKINNLDLNGDDKIDYIEVIDNVNGTDHTIVLQVAISKNENQDVAVFTVQKDAKGKVIIQLVGDEALYGKDYIIEPNYDDSSAGTPNPGYTGNIQPTQQEPVVVTKVTYVEVASWPVVTYMYAPTYVVYHSPYYWGYYPPYWNPWKPYYWHYYYGYHSHYYNHYHGCYRPTPYNRYPHYNNNYYYGHRSTSNTVNIYRSSGKYNSTYSRPETKQQGSADFNKKYPEGYRPTSGTNNNANRQGTRPVVNEPAKRPSSSNPATRPSTGNPATRPSTGNPATRPSTGNPSTRPSSGNPATRPSTGSPATRPSTDKSTAKPVSRENSVPKYTKPATATPSTRPATASPAVKPAPAKSSAKPAQTKSTSTHRKTN